MFACPLCQHPDTLAYHQDKKRQYRQCRQCQLVFVEAAFLPTQADELAEYRLHENHLTDPGYRTFLQRCAIPLLDVLAPASQGLDYGCGPAPLLAHMLQEHGHQVACYDPFFAPASGVLDQHFDFITCTEAIEHFHRPWQEWQRWQTMLKPNGWLAIMTKRLISREKFANWHYKNDPTHVCFYSDATFAWLASHWQMQLTLVSNDVVLLQQLTE